MAEEEEKKDEQPYQFTPEGGQPTNSSKGYSGKGTAVYPNGEIYEGDYLDGLREGSGKYTYTNGDVYNGAFKNNFKEGIGKIVYSDKGEYYGEWVAGQKQGEGMYIHPNKDVFSGQWQAGKMHGQGTYVFNATGMKYIGEWYENNFLKGKWAYPNGTYYDGDFQTQKPKGKGIWHLSHGNTVEGSYEHIVVPSNGGKLDTRLVWNQN